MTTKNNTKSAETLNENASNALKWFQEATSAIMDAQSKQLAYANEMYSKMMNNYLGEIKNAADSNDYNLPKKMMEIMQKSVWSFVELSNDAIKTVVKSGTYGTPPRIFQKIF